MIFTLCSLTNIYTQELNEEEYKFDNTDSKNFEDLIVHGTVKDHKNQALKFVNIGIKNKNIGAISDENGNYEIKINPSNLQDSITFSYLGFQRKSILIQDALNSNISNITLIEKPIYLDEIVLKSKNRQEKKLGTKSFSSMVSGSVTSKGSNKDIREFAKRLNIKKPSQILDLNINLFNVKIDTAVFRVNFYSIKNKLPFEKLGNQIILVKEKINNGWNSVDLEKYNLTFNEPVFIAIEYIPLKEMVNEPFNYSGKLFGKSITRSSSLGTWKVTKGATISMYSTILE